MHTIELLQEELAYLLHHRYVRSLSLFPSEVVFIHQHFQLHTGVLPYILGSEEEPLYRRGPQFKVESLGIFVVLYCVKESILISNLQYRHHLSYHTRQPTLPQQ